jgi:hypothetical protein
VTVGVGTARAESTASDSVAVAALLFPSVTVRVTANGEPVVAEGVQLIEAVLELLHPGGRLVHE